MRLYDILINESRHGSVPYHMPGHKRSSKFDYLGDAAAIDYTEIDGLDNLHAPRGIIREAMNYAREVYGADRSFMLVNGSTCGILAAVYSLCRSGGELIAARNCHKSVYNAAILCQSLVHYIVPRISETGIALDITPAEAERVICEHPNAAAVIITSPTYDGVVSDVAGIADVCHAHNIPLIVDAAHGAHLGFLDESVKSPVRCGADIVIMSLHKTLPSLTQTGIMHTHGNLVDPEKIAQSLAIFETSSPSYVLMASIDGCLHEMSNCSMFTEWRKKITKLREVADESEAELIIPDQVFAYDESKLILTCQNYSGSEIAAILRQKFKIEPESVSAEYVLLLTGAGDTWEMTEALCRAFRYFGKNRRGSAAPTNVRKNNLYTISLECRMKMSDALNSKSELIPLADAANRISADFIMQYPPGIPIIAPGEAVTPALVQVLEYFEQLRLTDLKSGSGSRLLTSSAEFEGQINVL